MPVLYRSRSVRRFNDTNCRITSLIEKDNTKVLAAASIQLFISTHQLEKWFKSSTGTICFLRDNTHRKLYYFRLYSLMQGQLWEQQIEAPFVYKKLSPIFHYLTVSRFNFGFKFICEDEAERFYSAITKFSCIETAKPEPLHSSPLNKKKMTSSLLFNSTTNSNGNSIDSINQIPRPIRQLNNSSTPVGNILFAASTASTALIPQASLTSSTHSLTSSFTSTKVMPTFLCSKAESNTRRSRREFLSTDRSKRILKSDISCPFRCSRRDLNTSGYSEQNVDQNSLNLKVSGSLNRQSSLSRNFVQKSENVQRVSSFSKVSLKSFDRKESSANYEAPKLHNSLNSISNSTSFTSLNSQKKLVENSTDATLKKCYEDQINFSKKYSLIINPDENKSQNKGEDLELEATKQILMEYDVPINKRIIKELRNYITQYGSIERFQKSLKMESERNKLNTFIASASASLMVKGKPIGLSNCQKAMKNNYVEHMKTSPSSHTKPNSFMSPLNITSQSILSTPPTTPHKTHTHSRPANTTNPSTPPITPNVTLASNISLKSKHQYHYNHQFQMLTPQSSQKNVSSGVTGQPPISNQSDRTPVKLPSHLINLNNRNQTPSPSRNSYQFRQNLANMTSTPSSLDTNAPPKPPRHNSLKIPN